MEDVLKSTATHNGAGIKRTIYFGLADDVETWPAIAASPTTYAARVTLTSAVEMKTDKQMFRFQATVRKSSFESLSAGERGAKVAINRLQIIRAEISPAVVGFIEQHKNDEMFLIINDLNGNPRFIGGEDLPAMLEEFSIPTGADVSDEKDVKITFEQAGKIAPFYGTAETPLAIPLTPAV